MMHINLDPQQAHFIAKTLFEQGFETSVMPSVDGLTATVRISEDDTLDIIQLMPHVLDEARDRGIA